MYHMAGVVDRLMGMGSLDDSSMASGHTNGHASMRREAHGVTTLNKELRQSGNDENREMVFPREEPTFIYIVPSGQHNMHTYM